MTLPHSQFTAILVLLLGMLCWGSWANTYKLGGKWRYELYYFDWIFGALVGTLILALSVGSLGYDGFSFRDDLMIAGKRQWLWAFVAGVIFNCGNMLLVACLSVAGMTVAFPMAAGVGMIVGAAVGLAVAPFGQPVFLLLGCALVAGAVVAAALVHRHMLILRHERTARAGKAKSTRRPSSTKAVVLAMVSGLLLGAYVAPLDFARQGENGLGPYSTAVLFVVGAFASTFILNLFLMNLPVEGEPLEVLEYFQGPLTNHLWGLAGGAIWSVGLITVLVVATLPDPARPGPIAFYGLSHGWIVLAALWGIVSWKELQGGGGRATVLAALTLLLLLGGITVLGVAPLFVHR
jgi:glucose uptake protein